MNITAIVVTRGDVELAPILAPIPWPVIVWDNSKHPTDLKTLGRHFAAMTAPTDLVYHQDDDIIFTGDFQELVEAWEPGVLTVNMPSPWYEDTGYASTGQVMFGAGSLVETRLTSAAIGHYLQDHPWDDDFLTYCDCILGYMIPSRRIDTGYRIMDYASADNRIYTQPDAPVRKEMMNGRGYELREKHKPDPKPVPKKKKKSQSAVEAYSEKLDKQRYWVERYLPGAWPESA